ncbi:hypothetical protein EHM76_02085 [bacterium]|nr:MAG: hypothetical protein EHM76_02085 [bacterium]
MRPLHRPVLLIALVLLLSACTAKPVRIDGIDYHQMQREGDLTRYENAAGQALLVDRSTGVAQVTVGGQVYRVAGSLAETRVIFPDGLELTRRTEGNGSMGLVGMGLEASMEDWNRVDELRGLVYGSQQSAPDPMRILFGLLAIAVGALQIANPRLAWQLSEGWRYQNLEPSDAYLLFSRLGGAVLVVIGLVLLVGGFA